MLRRSSIFQISILAIAICGCLCLEVDDLSVMVLSNSSDSNPEALAFDTARVFR